MTNLDKKKCVPCEGGVERMRPEDIPAFLNQLKPGWDVIDNLKIKKTYTFDSYMDGIEFVQDLAAVSEEEGHHPVIHIYYGHVDVEFWTHAILGLSENDFIMAAKTDLLESLKL